MYLQVYFVNTQVYQNVNFKWKMPFICGEIKQFGEVKHSSNIYIYILEGEPRVVWLTVKVPGVDFVCQLTGLTGIQIYPERPA